MHDGTAADYALDQLPPALETLSQPLGGIGKRFRGGGS